MPVKFYLSRVNSSDILKRNENIKERKTFVYSNRKNELNFDEMYDDLNGSVAHLVEENRTKLNSMNCTKSKILVNSTQAKLVAFMKARPGNRKRPTFSSTERSYAQKINIYPKEEQHKENRQQIFDMEKLEQIIKSYERNLQSPQNRFGGALAQKVLKLTGQKLCVRPEIKLDLGDKFEPNETTKNYLGWKSQKSKRRIKHMFS